ncbi:MAG: helix-turn-helix domain containing protein [Dehalococcoidia bacterium]|nr:helix-turn-helix domain containing protein [Dehalococcoidia bacterium]
MIRIQLTVDNLSKVRALRQDSTLRPAERDRVEMVLLSHSGWSPGFIGIHLGYCTATIRRVLRQFQSEGIQAIRHRARGPAPDTEHRLRIQTELTQLLPEERTWSSCQLSVALLDRGVTLSPRSVRRYLRQMNARYIRSCRTLRHKQDSLEVERSRNSLAKLKKSVSRES